MIALLTRFLEQLFLPPGVILTGLLLTLFGLGYRPGSLSPRRLRITRIILSCLFCITYIITIPKTAHLVADLLAPDNPIPAMTTQRLQEANAQAIVIFGYGRATKAPEYGNQDTLSAGGLARVRYGAWLHRHTHLPILVAGGRPYGEKISEARLMTDVLENEFNTPVQWLDEASNNTWENAANAAAILKAAKIERILLVVHYRDVTRALWSFQKVTDKIQVTLAPILFRQTASTPFSWTPAELLQWIPNADAMGILAVELHELIGKIWYQLLH